MVRLSRARASGEREDTVMYPTRLTPAAPLARSSPLWSSLAVGGDVAGVDGAVHLGGAAGVGLVVGLLGEHALDGHFGGLQVHGDGDGADDVGGVDEEGARKLTPTGVIGHSFTQAVAWHQGARVEDSRVLAWR